MKQLADPKYREGFTTELSKTQEQILSFIEEMQPVCRKIIRMKAGSYGETTINDNINELLNRDMIKENSNGALTTV